MKFCQLRTALIFVLLCLTFGLVYAQEATQEPSAARPALLPCVEGKNMPCVDNVDAIGMIVGTWRSYIRDDSGIHFGFTVYKEDGSIAVTSDPQAEPTVIGNVTFAKGLATITTNTNGTGAANCVGANSYEMRLIRMGNQPVALTYHAPNQNDICFGRVGGYVQPMLYYPGTGKDLSDLDSSSDALAQPLVPCLSLPRPCDVIATKLDDIKGLWKAYFSPVPEGFGFSRINEAGDMMMVGTGDDLTSLKEFFPAVSSNNFNGTLFSEDVVDTTNPCGGNVQYIRVIKFGDQQVALQWTAVLDACPPRKVDFSDAQIWVSGV